MLYRTPACAARFTTTAGLPAAHLIKKELNLKSGSAKPQADKVGQLSQEQLTKIAEIKMPDLNANDIDAAKKIIAGTARSMGVTIAE